MRQGRRRGGGRRRPVEGRRGPRTETESLTTIREARETDLPELAAIYAASIRGLGPAHYDPDAIEAWAAFAESEGFRDFVLENRTLVAEDGDASVGFGGIDDSGRIASLYVRPERGRTGVGSALLEALLEVGRGRGLTHFRSEASEFSRPLFEKFGFSVVGTEVVKRAGVSIERYRMRRDGSGVT